MLRHMKLKTKGSDNTVAPGSEEYLTNEHVNGNGNANGILSSLQGTSNYRCMAGFAQGSVSRPSSNSTFSVHREAAYADRVQREAFNTIVQLRHQNILLMNQIRMQQQQQQQQHPNQFRSNGLHKSPQNSMHGFNQQQAQMFHQSGPNMERAQTKRPFLCAEDSVRVSLSSSSASSTSSVSSIDETVVTAHPLRKGLTVSKQMNKAVNSSRRNMRDETRKSDVGRSNMHTINEQKPVSACFPAGIPPLMQEYRNLNRDCTNNINGIHGKGTGTAPRPIDNAANRNSRKRKAVSVSVSNNASGSGSSSTPANIPSIVNVLSNDHANAVTHLSTQTQNYNSPVAPLNREAMYSLIHQFHCHYNQQQQQQQQQNTTKKLKCNSTPQVLQMPLLQLPSLLSAQSSKATTPRTAPYPNCSARNVTTNASLSQSFCSKATSNDREPILTLALPTDAQHLNPIHHFVRRNIEVFSATEEDVAAPSPGRKIALKVGQVGLRCIHCRYETNTRKRTKRAVCYPSSIARVYNCVSDMKFDHFSNCPYMPPMERAAFEELRRAGGQGGGNVRGGRRSGQGKGGNNTAKYYYESAVKIGLVMDPSGIIVLKPKSAKSVAVDTGSSKTQFPISTTTTTTTKPKGVTSFPRSNQQKPLSIVPRLGPAASEVSLNVNPASKSVPKVFANRSPVKDTPFRSRQNTCIPVGTSESNTFQRNLNTIPTTIGISKSNSRPLAATQDRKHLNPIHCFVRENVEVFIADANDVNAPAPGRKKRVTLGQVGIRCIHCMKLPLEMRVKRAICYPPTISNLYHAVSNMKFDHFGACKGLSPVARQQFSDLKAVSNRKGNWTSTSCTARYYQQSAMKELGLMDSPAGIRVAGGAFLNKQGVSPPALHDMTSSSGPIKSRPNERDRVDHVAARAISNPPSVDKCAEAVHVIHKTSNMDGMSVLMLAATDSKMRQHFEDLKKARAASSSTVQTWGV